MSDPKLNMTCTYTRGALPTMHIVCGRYRGDGVGEAGRVLARCVGDHAQQDGAAAGRRASGPAHRAVAHRHAAPQGRTTQLRLLHTTYLF